MIDNLEWGRGNTFEANVANVNGPGVGFYLHQPDESGNVVRCDNVIIGAGSGFTNRDGGCDGYAVATYRTVLQRCETWA